MNYFCCGITVVG